MTHTPPPSDISIAAIVARSWSQTRVLAGKGRDVSYEVRRIENDIELARSANNAGQLPVGFDWDADLALAADHHALNLRWLTMETSHNSVTAGFWRDLAQRQYEMSSALMLSGLNLIVAAHGAVAISALNAMMQERGAKYQVALICAIFGACVGLLLVTAGKILAIETLSHISNRISGRLLFPTSLRVRAVGKYVEKVSANKSIWMSRLIYGSLIWFVIYVFGVMMMIVHA
jgi:hypothetical protein